jgi:hypothetical protein
MHDIGGLLGELVGLPVSFSFGLRVEHRLVADRQSLPSDPPR